MNEEEKKAIQMLDKFITEHKFYNIKHSDNLEDNIEIVLNLIEKQQKENEEIKNKNKTLEELLQGTLYEMYKYYRDLANSYQANCISKEKVKDKIIHYQELQDNYIKKYDEINEGLQAMINVLQELIEEREER